MSTFHERERAFENKFAHDQDMMFKAVSRRNRKIGLWAAGLLGLSGEDAANYALDVIRIDFTKPGHDVVVEKLDADLGDLADKATIETRMAEYLTEAKAELADG